jgi:hypothetical protein
VFARERATIRCDETRGISQKLFPSRDAGGREEIEVDAAMNATLAKVPVQ